MIRQQQSLAGIWLFETDVDGSMPLAGLNLSKQIAVPLPWQVAFPELQRYSGYAWYQREFELPDHWPDGHVLLHFGAVDYWCQVYVNDQLVGAHEGGYTPFTLPISAALKPGINQLSVRVYDSVQREMVVPRWPEYPATTSAAGPPFDANHIPHGKQEWYINVGGIWQDVTLLAMPETYLKPSRWRPQFRRAGWR